MNRRPWTRAERKVLREFYPWIPTPDIAEDLGRSVRTIYQQAQKMGLSKHAEAITESCRWKPGRRAGSEAHWFKKGQIPPNKGTRRPGYAPGRMRETQFKKGQRPRTWQPIGSLRTCDGYLQRKVTDTGYPPRDWQPEHRLIWEKVHGPIPAGQILAFKDKDRTHIDLGNLELITRRELARRNTIHRLPEELKEVIRLKGAIRRVITCKERKSRRGEKQVVGSTEPSLRDARSA